MSLIQNNRSYKLLIPQGIVLHETATPEATAQNEWDYFNNAYRGASAHAFVDWNGVIQAIPYDEQAWHAGATANKIFIGIEMCNTSDEVKFNKIYANTINLLSDLFIQFNFGKVTADNLLSHNDVSLKWHETDHTDPINYLAKFGLGMGDVRNNVNDAIRIKNGDGILAKISFVGEGKNIKAFVDGNEIAVNYLIECNGKTVCVDIAQTLRDLGHEVEWKAK